MMEAKSIDKTPETGFLDIYFEILKRQGVNIEKIEKNFKKHGSKKKWKKILSENRMSTSCFLFVIKISSF